MLFCTEPPSPEHKEKVKQSLPEHMELSDGIHQWLQWKGDDLANIGPSQIEKATKDSLNKLACQNLTISRAVSDLGIITGKDINYNLLDDLMVEINVLPEVPFYVKIACRHKESPCTVIFKY